MISKEGGVRSIVFDVLFLSRFPARSVIYAFDASYEKAKLVSTDKSVSVIPSPRYSPSGSFAECCGSEEPVNNWEITVECTFSFPLANAVDGFVSDVFVEYLNPEAAVSFVENLIPPDVLLVLTGSNCRAPPMISAA